MSLSSNKSRPISPQELFQRLLSKDIKSQECIDTKSKLKEERQLLLELNEEYSSNIKKVYQNITQEAILRRKKTDLLSQLHQLKQQRAQIDAQINSRMQKITIIPNEQHKSNQIIAEITQVRNATTAITMRIRDLMDYIAKLELHNNRLEQEQRIIKMSQINNLRVEGQWHSRLEHLKSDQMRYDEDIRKKIQEDDQNIQRSIRQQELDIEDRNKRRIESLKQPHMFTPYPKSQHMQSSYKII